MVLFYSLRDLPRRQPLRAHDQGIPRQEMQDLRRALHRLRVAGRHSRQAEEGGDMSQLRPLEKRVSGVHLRLAVRIARASSGQGVGRGGMRRGHCGGTPKRCQPLVDDGDARTGH